MPRRTPLSWAAVALGLLSLLGWGMPPDLSFLLALLAPFALPLALVARWRGERGWRWWLGLSLGIAATAGFALTLVLFLAFSGPGPGPP